MGPINVLGLTIPPTATLRRAYDGLKSICKFNTLVPRYQSIFTTKDQTDETDSHHMATMNNGRFVGPSYRSMLFSSTNKYFVRQTVPRTGTQFWCVCVCVFFPFILDINGRTSRGHTGGRSHRIFHPPSFCGAFLYLSREKDSAIPFPRRP